MRLEKILASFPKWQALRHFEDGDIEKLTFPFPVTQQRSARVGVWDLVVSQIRDTFLGVPIVRVIRQRSILGSPHFGKPTCRTSTPLRGQAARTTVGRPVRACLAENNSDTSNIVVLVAIVVIAIILTKSKKVITAIIVLMIKRSENSNSVNNIDIAIFL